jgi:hypothetical protein
LALQAGAACGPAQRRMLLDNEVYQYVEVVT